MLLWKPAREGRLFSRFSPASKRILRAAEQECRNRNHYYVGVEHMLLALLEERDPSVEERLGQQGVGSEEIRALLRRALGTGEDRSWDGILLTPRVRAVIRSAEEIAGDTAVEPLHLFTAIRNDDGIAAELLRKGGRSSDAV